jgi:hypothetical protein
MHELLVYGCVACALAGCGAAERTDTTRTPQSTRAAATVGESAATVGASAATVGASAATVGASAASCAALTPRQELAAARLVFIGRFAPGPTIRAGDRNILLSPARFHVGRYVKGHGPATLRVVTAVTAPGRFSEDGIEAQAGERWLIYTNSKHGPYDTSICGGSRRVARQPR